MMQELSQADKEEAGRVPRTLEVELTRDLVDSCSAGDVVTVLGIIKVLSTDAEAGMLSHILSSVHVIKGTSNDRTLALHGWLAATCTVHHMMQSPQNCNITCSHAFCMTHCLPPDQDVACTCNLNWPCISQNLTSMQNGVVIGCRWKG